MYCKGCSANIPDRSVSCDYCGADLIVAIDPTSSSLQPDTIQPVKNGPSEDLSSKPAKSTKNINVLNMLLLSIILIPTFLYLYYWWMVPHESEMSMESQIGKSSLLSRNYETRPPAALRRGAKALPDKDMKGMEETADVQETKTPGAATTSLTDMETPKASAPLEAKTGIGQEIDPAADLFNKGLGLISERKYQEALTSLLTAYEIKGSEEIAHTLAYAFFHLGIERIKSRVFGEALDNFENSLKYHPREAKYLYGVGLAYFYLDNYYLASLNLQEAITLDPGNFDALQLLGEISYRQNRLSEAIQFWKSALLVQPEDKKLAAKLAKALREEKVEGGFTEGVTGNFVLRYDGAQYEKIGGLALDYLNMAYNKIGFDLDFYPPGEITTILYHEEAFKDVTMGPTWANGIFDGKIRLPIKDSPIDEEAFSRTIFHEFTHAAIYQLTKGNVPTWLNEGIALYEEGSLRPQLEEALEKAFQDGSVFSMRELEKSFMNLPSQQAAVAYAQSHSMVKFILESYSMTDLQDILKKLGQTKTIEQALEESMGLSPADLENEWRASIGLPLTP